MTDYRNKFTNSGQKITLTDSLRKEELFDTSGNKIIQSISDNSYLGEAESERFIKSYIKQRSRYIPKLDYSDPSSFCFYGSSERYYKDSIDRVYNTYPYDGSKAEKMEWSLTASYLDLYMLEHEYPKAKGHVAFSNGGWGTRAAVEGAYGLSSTPEYIYFVGGPHSGTMFNSSKKRESNLKIDGSTGNTAEFWLKKQSFVGSSLTTREVIFDTHTSGAITGTSTHGRFTVLLDSSVGSGSPFKLTYLSGTAGITDQVLGTTAVTKATVADNAWHHYAVTVVHSGSNIVSKLYVDGALEDTNTASVASFGAVDRNFVGTIGALATGSSGGTDAKIGYGKLSGSLDEFRYWKTARTEKQIGRYFYRPVHGGTDKDNNNPELGLYYKFNEGIIGVQSYDEVVLDYSGRIGNGKVIGWSDTFRSSLSGIESSTNLPEASYSEPGDPIINGKNPLVQDLLTKFKNFGKSHDIQNGSSLANTVPSYFMQEDKTGLMGELVQIIAATLDDIFLKIKFLPSIKDYNYRDFFDQKGVQQSSDTNNFLLGCEDSTDYKFTGNHSKPWVNYILEHFGLATTEIFPNADLIETFLQKSDKLTFEQNLHEVKNAILSNIHSNLIHIYNTKGTEKSFRNLIRCFGVDDELIKLNVYGNNESYKLEKKPIYTTVKQKSLNFANANYQGTLYQTASNKLYMEQRYITSSTEPKPLTLEASIVFPDNNSITTNLQTASLFGMHSVQGASGSGDALTWHPLDSGSMQAYFVRRSNFAGDGYFLLTSSAGAFTAVSSSYIPGVYDNTHWNISVRVAKKGDIDFGLTRLSGSTGYKVEFTGYNYDLDALKNSFYVTSSITRTGYEMMSSLDRAVYAGSHKTNFTGSHLHSSDVRLLGFNVHLDGLTNDELKEHAKNPAVFGRTDPQHVSNFDDGSNLRATDATVLRWQFENLVSSSAGGTLSVLDFTSGSIETPSGSLVGYKYPGAASGFAATGSAIVQEFIPSVEYAPIDNVYSSDRVQIKSTEVEKFTAGSRPVTYFYSFEKSMYQVISKEMINMFAGITGMSNLIGEPVNKYRQEYKMMEKMREKFFRNVENDMDLDKFVEYYKWIDSSLSHFIQQLVPASSNFSGRIREIVESHALERNKYKHQAPTVEYKDPTVNPVSILGVNELLYDWEHGHAPLQASHLTNIKALQFSSNADTVDIADSDDMSFTDGAGTDSAFSISAWVHVGDIASDSGVIMSRRNSVGAGNQDGEWIIGHTNGGLYVILYADPAQNSVGSFSTTNRIYFEDTGTKLSSATWHQITVTYDGSQNISGLKVYKDATEITPSSTTTKTNYSGMPNFDIVTTIGGTDSPTTNTFEDFIADVAVFNKELSTAEVTEVYNGGKVKNLTTFTAYSNIISWWKMGDDLDAAGSNNIKDYKGSNHGTMVGSTAIVASTGLDSDREVTDPKETTNCLWQKDRSERSSDRETIRRVAVTDVSGSTYVLRKLSRPYRFSAEQSKPIGTGFNRKTNKNPELYKMATRAGKVELAAVTEEPVCKDVIDPNFTEHYRGSTNNINDDSYLDADSDLLFPFTMISSSVGVDLEQVKENLQIANNHLDIGLTGEQSLQSPFTRQHVGGMPHRKVEMGLTGSDVRPEAYSLTTVPSASFDVRNFYITVATASLSLRSPYSTSSHGKAIIQVNSCSHMSRFVNLIYHEAGGDFQEGVSWPDTTSSFSVVFSNGVSHKFVDQPDSTTIEYDEDKFIISFFPTASMAAGINASGTIKFSASYNGQYYSGPQPSFAGLTASSVTTTLLSNSAINLSTASLSTPKSMFYRDGGAGAPYVFKNVKYGTGSNILGNYNKDYEIVQTNGRSLNNNQLVDDNGLNVTPVASKAVSGTIDFVTPVRQRTGHVIVNKFSSPGGPETQGAFASDQESQEYSIYNSLNYRNSIARNTLNKLSTEQSDQFGYRSGSTTQASVHMTNRNPTRRTGSLGKEVDFDNNFISRPIPQSDYQYSWITASVNDNVYDFLSKNDNFGYVHGYALSSSSTSPDNISSNQIGFATTRRHVAIREPVKVSTLQFRHQGANAESDFLSYNAAVSGSRPVPTQLVFTGSSADLPFSYATTIQLLSQSYDGGTQVIVGLRGNYRLSFHQMNNNLYGGGGDGYLRADIGGTPDSPTGSASDPFDFSVYTKNVVNYGSWHNITVTYDGKRNVAGLKVYLDGKRLPQHAGGHIPGTDGAMEGFDNEIDIGNIDFPVDFFSLGIYGTYNNSIITSNGGLKANMKNLLFFDKELSQEEVTALYNKKNEQPFINEETRGVYPNYRTLPFYNNAVAWWDFTDIQRLLSISGSSYNGFEDRISGIKLATRRGKVNPAGNIDGRNFGAADGTVGRATSVLFMQDPNETYIISDNSLQSGSDSLQSEKYFSTNYNFSTLTQIRGSEHPIARAHRKDNTISIAVRGSEVMPSVHNEYLFDFNKDLQNISGIDKKTVDRTFINYTEPMVTNRFNPMTITLHNEQVGGLSLENIRLMQEEAYLSQREEEDVWNLDEGLITAMVTSDTGPDGITRRPVDNRLLILRKTYQNDLTSFANANITDKLEIDDFKRHTFNDLLLSYQREFSTDEGTTMELNYVETIYPREENTYTKNARLRENFHFFGWNSSRTSRSIILTGSNAYNSSLVTAGTSNLFPEITVDKDDYQRTNPFFVDAVGSNSSVNPTRFTHVRASTWPLDARETFSRAPLSITSSFFNEGKDFLPFRKQGQFGEGVLQNDYSIFGLGVNTVHGTPPPAPIYSRRIPQTYSGNTFLAGEAKWEAADQSGQVPFVDSYEEYREKIRTLGQDHSIVPEFRISEFIEDTIKNNDGNFLASTSISENFLSLTGAIYNQSSGDLEVGSSFFKTYATSDFMKYFNPIVEQTDIEGFKNDVDPMRLTLKCQAAMKFVPYRGFYPAERVLQIAELFGRGYMSDFSFTNTQQDTRISQTNSGVRNLLERKIRANLQQSIKPLMAPGILFNSIKSGMAVDYPLFGSDADASTISSFGTLIDRTTHLTGGYGGTLKALTMYTGSLVNQSTTYTGSVIPSSIPRLSGSVYKRVTFEDLLEPDRLRGTLILDNEPHPSASIHYGNSELGRVMDYPFKFGQLDTTRTEQKLNADSFSLKKPLSETLVPYKMAINNFCAETVNFFLEDGSSATLESDEVEVRLAASTAYKMRVYVRNKDLTMYDRHSAFGPPVDEGRSVTKAKFKSQQIIVSGSGARKDMGFLVRNYDLASGSSNIPLDNSLPGIVMTGSGGNKVAIKFVTASVPNTTNITNNPGNGTTAEGTFNATGLGNIYLKGTSSYIDVNSIKTNFADPFGVKYDQDTNQYIDYNRSSALAQLIRYGVNVIAHNSSSGIVADVTLKQVTDKNLFPADVPSGATYLRYNLEFVQTANATASAGVSWRNIKENSTGSATIPQSRAEHWFETYPVSGSRNFIGGAADNPVTKLTHKVNVTDHDGHGYAPYHPPFLDKNAEPYVEISFTPSSAGTYTLDQIWEGATFTYNNFYQEPSNANTATTKRNNTNFNHAMAISASIDLKSFVQYQAEENAPGSNRDGRKRWVIQSKWETPVLQFANATASALKLSDNTVASVTNSPWQNRTWTQYFSQSLATSEPYLTASTGMWHQYGALPAKVGEGYELAVEEIEGLDSSKQLARLVGFTSENKRSAKATPGRISEFKEIAESVVAIPYYVTDDDQVEFFDISEEIMLKARTLNEGRKRQLGNGTLTSEEYDKLFNTPGSNPTLLTAYQMRMMEKYVMPPQFDFVTYPELAKTSRPMMYVFQFRAAMKKQDLQNIWQNLSPTSAVSTGKARYSATRANETKFGLESDVQYVSHFLDVDKTPFEGSDQKAFLEEKVRWIVFKVKMRAEKDLSKIKRESLPGLKSGKKIANTSIKDSGYFYKDDSNDPVINESRGINGLKYKHSFNWPYDYFSMVELIKVESKVDFLPKPPNQRN